MNKATGPDGISARVLMATADVVADPLCHIFNQSLKFGTVTDDWRHANKTPIYKKGVVNLKTIVPLALHVSPAR